ncbi:hypothetical protein HY493_04290 [Candidatus Woesearchaeota archaeon]|nr:hypothetical protein [Candidatus Woesearchaeota archaeon]
MATTGNGMHDPRVGRLLAATVDYFAERAAQKDYFEDKESQEHLESQEFVNCCIAFVRGTRPLMWEDTVVAYMRQFVERAPERMRGSSRRGYLANALVTAGFAVPAVLAGGLDIAAGLGMMSVGSLAMRRVATWDARRSAQESIDFVIDHPEELDACLAEGKDIIKVSLKNWGYFA